MLSNEGMHDSTIMRNPSLHHSGSGVMHDCTVTLGAHAQKGYGTCLVCLFVCLLPLNLRHRSFLRSN